MDGLLSGNGLIDPYSLTLASEVVFSGLGSGTEYLARKPEKRMKETPSRQVYDLID